MSLLTREELIDELQIFAGDALRRELKEISEKLRIDLRQELQQFLQIFELWSSGLGRGPRRGGGGASNASGLTLTGRSMLSAPRSVAGSTMGSIMESSLGTLGGNSVIGNSLVPPGPSLPLAPGTAAIPLPRDRPAPLELDTPMDEDYDWTYRHKGFMLSTKAAEAAKKLRSTPKSRRPISALRRVSREESRNFEPADTSGPSRAVTVEELDKSESWAHPRAARGTPKRGDGGGGAGAGGAQPTPKGGLLLVRPGPSTDRGLEQDMQVEALEQTNPAGLTAGSLPCDVVRSISEDGVPSGVQLFRRQSSGSLRHESIEEVPELESIAYEDLGVVQRCWWNLESFVSSQYFNGLICCLVVINVVMIGVQTDYVAKHIDKDLPTGFLLCERSFCVVFVFEILLRIWVYRTYYFTQPGWEWNVFDCLVVGFQVLEEILRTLVSFEPDLRISILFMRMLRVLRLIQIIRAIRILRFIGQLRTLVFGIGHSLKFLGWTLLLFAIVIYIVGIWFTQIVSEYRARSAQPHTNLEQHYGSLGDSLLLLFQSVTGGVDWDIAVAPLKDHISPWMAVLYVLYIAFVVLAMMNVITGTFVEDALRSAKEDKDYFMINNVREIFNSQEGGVQAGALTWADFESQLDKPQMLEYFAAIDVDPSEARGVFKLLDLDGSGSINAEEFLSGCLGLRGPAKALDLALLMHEVRHLGRWLNTIAREMESRSEQQETSDAAKPTVDAAPKEPQKPAVPEAAPKAVAAPSHTPPRPTQQQAYSRNTNQGPRLAARHPRDNHDAMLRTLG